jgi:SAM-dependent methyltransferase
MVWLYESYQFTVYPKLNRKRFVSDYLPAGTDLKVLDLGCGPAIFTQFLKFNTYCGVDIDLDAITRSRRLWQHDSRVFFYHGSAAEFDSVPGLTDHGPFDLILAHGLLHHLTDMQVRATLLLCRKYLAPHTGVLVTADPCFFDGQHPISWLVASLDRGHYVRERHVHEGMIAEVFPEVSSLCDNTLLIFPFDLLVATAKAAPAITSTLIGGDICT